MAFEHTDTFKRFEFLVADQDMEYASLAAELAYGVSNSEEAANLAMLTHANSLPASTPLFATMFERLGVESVAEFLETGGDIVSLRTFWNPDVSFDLVQRFPQMSDNQKTAILAHMTATMMRMTSSETNPAPAAIVGHADYTARVLLDTGLGNPILREHLEAFIPRPNKPINRLEASLKLMQLTMDWFTPPRQG